MKLVRNLSLSVLLFACAACQTVQTTLTAVVAGHVFGGLGVGVGIVLNVLVFYVLAEAVPKTYAVLYPQRAALLIARPTRFIVGFPLLQWISRGLIKLTNVIVRQKKPLESIPAVTDEIRACEAAFGNSGRIVVRFSGTEPLARVMVEGPDQRQVDEFSARIANAIRRELE